MRATLALLLLFALAPSLAAGFWDRDRPTDEDLPSYYDIIAGRFDRPPELYYEMRYQRTTSRLAEMGAHRPDIELETFHEAFRLYDNAAVAAFRLDRTGDAIVLIDRKLLLLEDYPKTEYATYLKQHSRALLNKATCLMHRGMANDAREDLEHARELLDEVIELDRHNLDAAWILTEVEWHLSNPAFERGNDPIFPNMLGLKDASFRGKRGLEALERNQLAGVLGYLGRRIVDGEGWNDVDVIYAYCLALALADHEQEAVFAWLRVQELIEDGVRSRVGDAPSATIVKNMMRIHLPDLEERTEQEKLYQEMRKNADAWVDSRNAYALDRMNQGRHPDTDESFWAGWRLEDKGLPEPGRPEPATQPLFSKTLLLGGIGGLLVVMLLILMATLLLGRRNSPHPTVDEV